MNHRFVISYIHEYNDRGAATRNVKECIIPIEQLLPGEIFNDVFGHELRVIAIDDEEMMFKYRGKEFSLNTKWQL